MTIDLDPSDAKSPMAQWNNLIFYIGVFISKDYFILVISPNHYCHAIWHSWKCIPIGQHHLPAEGFYLYVHISSHMWEKVSRFQPKLAALTTLRYITVLRRYQVLSCDFWPKWEGKGQFCPTVDIKYFVENRGKSSPERKPLDRGRKSLDGHFSVWNEERGEGTSERVGVGEQRVRRCVIWSEASKLRSDGRTNERTNGRWRINRGGDIMPGLWSPTQARGRAACPTKDFFTGVGWRLISPNIMNLYYS